MSNKDRFYAEMEGIPELALNDVGFTIRRYLDGDEMMVTSPEFKDRVINACFLFVTRLEQIKKTELESLARK